MSNCVREMDVSFLNRRVKCANFLLELEVKVMTIEKYLFRKQDSNNVQLCLNMCCMCVNSCSRGI